MSANWAPIKWPRNHACPRCKRSPKTGGGFLYSPDLFIDQPTHTDGRVEEAYRRAWEEIQPGDSLPREFLDHPTRVTVFVCCKCETFYAHDWSTMNDRSGDLGQYWIRMGKLDRDPVQLTIPDLGWPDVRPHWD